MKTLAWFIIGCVFTFTSLTAQTLNRFIIIDQFGYLPSSKKIAVIKDPQTGFDADLSFTPGNKYMVVNARSGEHVYWGEPVVWNSGATDASSGDKAWHFDFSAVSDTGNYYIIDSVNNQRSYEFRIAADIYHEVLKHAVRSFFYQRAGFPKEERYAGKGWADGASHIGPLQDKNARLYNDRNNASKERDLSGGWYDAGDYNKYTNWTASYVIEMLKAYLENPAAWADNYNIPESGNGIPDLIDEARWGMDHLLRMQQSDGGVLSIVSLSHASPPSSATGPSIYGPASTSATFNTAAALALGSRVYRSVNLTDYAETLIARAESAWQWGIDHPAVIFHNNSSSNGSQGVGAGNQEVDDYGRMMAKLKAACYLFEATGKKVYKDFFDANFNKVHMIQWTYVYPYEASNQEILLYYTRIPGATPSVVNQIKTAYVNALNNNSENFPAYNSVKDPYMAHLDNYTWGSNNQKGAQGSAFYNNISYGLNASKNQDAFDAALGYVHYIHGVNPLNLVYLSNMYQYGGDSCVNEFYHTWFTNGSAKWDRVGTSLYGPPPGYVPGGPNPSYNWDGCCPDGCGGAANNAVCKSEDISPPKDQPKQKSYKDFNTSWPLNSWEVTENSCGYQVSYIRLLSKFVSGFDCAGDSAGTAAYDLCGICSGGNSGREPATETCDCPDQEKKILIELAGCDSIVSPNGKFIWKTSGVYNDSLKTSTGCDSIIVYNVNISNTVYHSITDTACGKYILPGGSTVTTTGIYTETLTSVTGCDSIITIDLYIPVPDVNVSQEEDTLTASAEDGTLRWLRCNDYAVVEGATGNRFTPFESGEYAVEVTLDGCVDTSMCYSVEITSTEYNQFGDGLKVFPNPAQSQIHVHMPDQYDFVEVQMRNTAGMLVLKERYTGDRRFTVPVNVLPGIYFLTLMNNEGQRAVVKVEIRR